MRLSASDRVGAPVLRAPIAAPIARRAVALNAPFPGGAYDAADMWGQHMQGWVPPLWSADTTIGQQRDRIVSRVRDIVRNDGWGSAAVTRTLDSAIGIDFRPISKPDYRALAHISGNSAFDAQWAAEYGRAVDANWRLWTLDTGRYSDAERMLSFAQQANLAFRHWLVDGDALALLPWMQKRVAPGRARYATTVQIVDPDRLSNPQQMFDQRFMRNGVEIDEDGAPIAYHLRRAHQFDWFSAPETVVWDRYPRETSWGRPQVVHLFDRQQAGQHRGGAGFLTPVLQRLRMLTRYDGAELDSSIINAIFAAYIESPYDAAWTAEALEGDDLPGAYQAMRTGFHQTNNIRMQGSRIPILAPGEKINTVTAARPASNFRDFERAVLNNVSAGAGMAPMQLSNDWSDVNYSSARGALLEAWKTIRRRRGDFGIGFADPIRVAWLEESMDVDDLPLPRNAPEFIEARHAYARCKWLGPGRGWIDPVSEKQGSILGMDAGLSTLEDECAEQEGADWEERVDQRAVEIAAFRERGIPLPEWTQAPAKQAEKKPDED